MLCFSPMLGLLALFSIQTGWHSSPDVGSVELQARTCESGAQLMGKVSPAGYYHAEIGYGFTKQVNEDWRVSVIPGAGVSYVDHPNPNLPLRTQFALSLAGMVSYRSVGLHVEYGHDSNAGLRSPNVGMDFFKVGLTWRF